MPGIGNNNPFPKRWPSTASQPKVETAKVEAPVAPAEGEAVAAAAPAPAQSKWVPKASDQVRVAVTDLEAQAKTSALAIGSQTLAAAKAQPVEMLRLVKNGEVDLVLPLRPGTQLTGALEVAGTQIGNGIRGLSVEVPTNMKIHAVVKDGKLVASQTKVDFDPPIKGPIWSKLTGITLTDKGQAKIALDGLPDPKVGPAQSSLDLGAMVDVLSHLQHGGKPDSSLFGIKFSLNVPVDPSKPLEAAGKLIDTAAARLEVKGVEMREGTMKLGSSGQVRFADGGKLDLRGNLDELRLTGHANIADLNLNQDGVLLKGGTGSTDLDVTLKNVAGAQGPSVTTSLSNLNIDVSYAATTRANGDYLELAQGTLKNGSIQVSDHGANARVQVKDFEGQLKRARLTVADGDGTAQVNVNGAHVKGSFDISREAIALDGDITDADATLENYQGEVGSASADVKRLELKGSVHVAMDKGAKSLVVDGKGEIDLAVRNVQVGAQGVSMNADAAHLKGAATAHFDTATGVTVKGDLRLSASLHDGKVSLPGVGSFELKAGTSIDGALKEVAFGPHGNNVKLENTRLDAELSKGSLTLPTGGTLDVTNARVGFVFESLSGGAKGIPTARGSMTLEANIGVKETKNLKLPGVKLGQVKGFTQSLEVKLGSFSIASDGNFEVSKMTYAMKGQVDRFWGHIEAAPAKRR